jgi:hypothetical protein
MDLPRRFPRSIPLRTTEVIPITSVEIPAVSGSAILNGTTSFVLCAGMQQRDDNSQLQPEPEARSNHTLLFFKGIPRMLLGKYIISDPRRR